jgi:formylglycine-generating enzyme
MWICPFYPNHRVSLNSTQFDMKIKCIIIGVAALPLLACAQKDSQPLSAPNLTITATVNELLKTSIKNMIFVQGGIFQMGDFGRVYGAEKLPHNPPYAFSDPMHEVELDSFSIGRYKVTYDEFDIYTQSTGKAKIAQAFFDLEHRKIPNAPAGTNWQDAKDYCLWLAKETNQPFDLPTEAQWEYAARNRGKFILFATNNGEFEAGKNAPSYDQFKDIQSASGVTYGRSIFPVGKFPPSPLGLYDMAGNGTDWMNDWWDKDYYAKSPRKNPTGPQSGQAKVIRGIELDYSTSVTSYRLAAMPIQDVTVDKDTKKVMRTITGTLNFRCALNLPKPFKF